MKNLIKKYFWAGLILMLVTLFFVNISSGSIAIPFADTLRTLTGGEPADPVWKEILLNFRLPKSVTCMLAGASLALGGLLMQTLFRNPLAGPDVFGLSSGASLAVALVVMAGFLPVALSSFSIVVAASLGCALTFLIVLAISRRVRDTTSLLIIGLMIGATTSSFVSVLQMMSRAEEQQYYLIWTFGSLGHLNWQEIQILFLAVVAGATLAYRNIKSLNSWLLGDNYARSMGINIKRSRILIIIATSILTGAVTAFCGPIAFVGLAVPHLTRMLTDTMNHKTLIPAVMLYGAALMLLCDTLAQLPGDRLVIPINAITALIGAPVVILIIMRGKKITV